MKTAKERFDLALMNPIADVLEALETSVQRLKRIQFGKKFMNLLSIHLRLFCWLLLSFLCSRT